MGHRQCQDTRSETTYIGEDVPEGIEDQRLPLAESIIFTHDQRQPRADQLPHGVDADDKQHNDDKLTREDRLPPRIDSAGIVFLARFRMLNHKILVANHIQPQEHPRRSDDGDSLKTKTPASRLRSENREHHQRGQDRADRCPALQHTVPHRSPPPTQEGLRGLQTARPMGGFEEAEQEPAPIEFLIVASPTGQETH